LLSDSYSHTPCNCPSHFNLSYPKDYRKRKQNNKLEVVYDTYIEDWNADIEKFEMEQVLQIYHFRQECHGKGNY